MPVCVKEFSPLFSLIDPWKREKKSPRINGISWNELNVCIAANLCWNTDLQYDSNRRWGFWGMIRTWKWALINGNSKGTQKLLTLFSMYGHWENIHLLLICYSTAPDYAGILISDFQTPGLWEISFCYLQATQSMVHCYRSPNRLR